VIFAASAERVGESDVVEVAEGEEIVGGGVGLRTKVAESEGVVAVSCRGVEREGEDLSLCV
jgi:hypothetical protein